MAAAPLIAKTLDMRKVILLMLLASAAVGQQVAYENTQTGMNDAADRQLESAETEMQGELDQMTQRAKRNSDVIAKLQKSQAAWQAYRDAQLEAMWPGDPAGYGSVQPMCVAESKTAMTRARTRELRQMQSPSEGDACASRWPE